MSEQETVYQSESLDQERRGRISELLPEMERRYAVLFDLLSQANGGLDVSWTRLDLARRDLLSVLGVMRGEDEEDEDA